MTANPSPPRVTGLSSAWPEQSTVDRRVPGSNPGGPTHTVSRDDNFTQVCDGIVEADDGTRYPDPDKNVIRFESPVQLLRFIHHQTGQPMDELWDEYESQQE